MKGDDVRDCFRSWGFDRFLLVEEAPVTSVQSRGLDAAAVDLVASPVCGLPAFGLLTIFGTRGGTICCGPVFVREDAEPGLLAVRGAGSLPEETL